MSATLRFDVVGDASKGRRELDSLGTAGERAGRGLKQTQDGASRAQGPVGSLAGKIGGLARSYGPLAAAAGGAAVLKFGADALKSASDTQQAMGAIDSVFGKNAGVVKSWAASAADDVGLAQSAYGNLAVVLGSMLKNTGIEDYSGKTKELIKLGSDLSATYGGSVEEAVSAVGSLMRGETDPIERYGVSIKDADVQARLAAQGLSKLTGKARTQAEANARLTLLFNQTRGAQGAFGREAGTVAGQQQRLTARVENLKSSLGSRLLPAVQSVLQWLNNTASGSNRTAQVLASMAGTVRNTVTPPINAARTALNQITGSFNTAGGSSARWRGILQTLGTVAAKVAPVIGTVLAGAVTSAGTVISGVITTVNAIVSAIRAISGAVSGAIGALGRLGDAVRNIPNPASGIGGLIGLVRSGEGLARASGAGVMGATFRPVSFTSAPQIHLTFNDRRLRDLIRVEVQDQLSSAAGAITGGLTR